MGFFDLLKRFVGSNQRSISNAQYQRKRQKEIDQFEQKYDLSTVEGISSIPIPRFKALSSNESITGKIEYYLLLKGGQYEKVGESELAIACYRKANELMPMSSTVYQRESYMRLPRYLRKLRRFDEAREEENKINTLFSGDGVFEQSKAAFLADMKYFGHSKKHTEELYREYKAERDAEHQRELCRADYDWLWEFLPELCPKSFSGYMRMKNANTEKFQKIVAEAKKLGRDIR